MRPREFLKPHTATFLFARAAVPAAHEISHEISQRVNGRERSTHTAHTRDAELNAELLS